MTNFLFVKLFLMVILGNAFFWKSVRNFFRQVQEIVYFSGNYKKLFPWLKNWFFQKSVKIFLSEKLLFWVSIRKMLGRNFFV